MFYQAAPAHLSPFIDNETQGYMPERQREINALAGIETTVTGPAIGGDSESEEEDEKQEEQGEVVQKKGDIDSSSDEGTSEELSDSEDEEPADAKKGPSKKKSAQKAKQIQKKVLTKADRQAKNDKIKRDLKKEQQEMGKMLMTNRQKKMY